MVERPDSGPAAAFQAGVVAAWGSLVAGCGDDFGAELVNDVVVGVRG